MAATVNTPRNGEQETQEQEAQENRMLHLYAGFRNMYAAYQTIERMSIECVNGKITTRELHAAIMQLPHTFVSALEKAIPLTYFCEQKPRKRRKKISA